jgi:choline dehydrogenase-like flavoprotein
VPLAPEDVPEPGTIVGLGWFCAKDLQETDRVEFDDTERDGYGMPAMRIHYRLTERDHASIAAAREAVRRTGAALGEPLDPDPLTFPPGASLHYQGTVRMGEADDGTSVCSPTSEVWGIDGLYVAGNGVIPTATACNPTLTSVALAVRGAREIARTLTTERN